MTSCGSAPVTVTVLNGEDKPVGNSELAKGAKFILKFKFSEAIKSGAKLSAVLKAYKEDGKNEIGGVPDSASEMTLVVASDGMSATFTDTVSNDAELKKLAFTSVKVIYTPAAENSSETTVELGDIIIKVAA